MPNWFKAGPPPYQTSLAMIGAKAGDRLLMLGADEVDLAAAVAVVTGLNGRALVVDPAPGAAGRVAAAAARAGALVDFLQAAPAELPGDAGPFDVVAVVTPLAPLSEPDRRAAIGAAAGVLRPGGRVVVIDGRRQTGLFRRPSQGGTRLQPGTALALLTGTGLRAARQLADADGVAFYEARKS